MVDKNSNENKVIANLFQNLDNWRHHPKYQLERRVDIFFSLYLKEVLEDKFKSGNGFYIADKLIPEFLVRKGTILENFKDHQHKNMSYNIDYLTTCKDLKNIIFIELKTDNKSINKKQNYYLEKTMEKNFYLILTGIKELCKATKSKFKYYYLLRELELMGLVSNLENLGKMMEKIKDVQRFPSKKYDELIDEIEITDDDYYKHLFIIQPTKKEWVGYKGANIIIFDDFIKVLEKYNDEISGRFKESLKNWVAKPVI